MLPEEAVAEFKEIYKKEFGQVLSDKDARDEAESFFELMRIIARPIPEESANIKLQEM